MKELGDDVLGDLSADASAAMRSRDDGVDACRGAAVLLVVVGHVIDGLVNAGLTHGAAWGEAFRGIYSLHVPVLLFLSGVVATASPFAVVAGRRARTLLWPYVVWSAVYVALFQVAGGLSNEAHGGWSALLTVAWRPIGVLWFLLVLYFALLVVQPSAGILGGRTALALLAVVLELLHGAALLSPPVVERFAYGLLFVVAGALLTTKRLPDLVRPTVLAVSVPAGAVLLGLAAAGRTPMALIPWGSLIEVAAFVGLLSVRPSRLLAWVGKRSLPIFLVHAAVAPAARIALQHGLGLTNAVALLAACTAVGAASPLVLLAATERAGFPWLFRVPSRRTAPEPVRQAAAPVHQTGTVALRGDSSR